MHDNHHLQSTVAYQNTGQTVLSRRATALLRLRRIRYQVHTKYIYIFMQCAHITSLKTLVYNNRSRMIITTYSTVARVHIQYCTVELVLLRGAQYCRAVRDKVRWM